MLTPTHAGPTPPPGPLATPATSGPTGPAAAPGRVHPGTGLRKKAVAAPERAKGANAPESPIRLRRTASEDPSR